MGRIAVKIVSDGANTSGGRADSMMLTQYASDVVRVPDDIAASECSGGILPITQAEYDLLGLTTARDTADSVITALTPAAWYRNATGVTEAGGFASQWDDYSGNARHLVQNTGTNQPAYSAGVFTFDGADNWMAASYASASGRTRVFVVKQISWSANEYIACGGTANSQVVFQNNATPEVDLYAGAFDAAMQNSGLAVGAFGILVCVFNGASSSIRVNNNAKTTGNVGTTVGGGLTLAAINSGGSAWGNVAFKEVIDFPTALSDADQDSVVTALNNALTVF